ncbi:hypothetical protein [Streptomyces sioyaensis]|uniref:hypothetical protein n=1 Tax=Streptomyces sioyaensis TaxID=67364 RepID=UPI003793A0DA
MLIAPAAVLALLILTGLVRAVGRWRRRRAAARTAQRLTEAQLQRDIDALTADVHSRASAARVLHEADRVLDAALTRYGHTPRTTHPDQEGDGDEQP